MKQATEAVVFGTSTIADTWAEAEALMYHHAAEVGPLPFAEFQPNRHFYDEMEKHGVLDVFTMRADGKLVGYALFTTLPHPDFKSAIWCRESCIYVEKKWRGAQSIGFQEWQHRQLRAKHKGCAITRYSTSKHDRGPVLRELGFREMETGYILDREAEEVRLGG